ncbi:MAG: OmpH family outer membrane protein [Bacteroidales bacterium]|jgi:outer membrane protein|nr:OmpH family outer membrane protein [Bacteroidales bacterium]MEE3406921.1 OmpH family outer membrane protein [Candidatus Cryptobacteroides sp.]SKC57926.1 periplasmic chaperone for outer membrane proteins Skp [Bacteroidales bacterium WCE2008]MBO7366936.1 OmpH family outer membrane protein [Bacteroidales bacterium]MBP5234824.1 OmpH family outer membrane protein [Bacteroidales bacterium]
MKNTPLILSVIALVAVAALGIIQLTSNKSNNAPAAAGEASVAAPGSIVYFNLDRVLKEYDMANDLSSVVETKVQSIQEEVNRRGNKLQKDINAFQDKINKGTITSASAAVQQDKLQQQNNEFQNYAAQKQQEIAEEQQVMMNQIGDAIKSFLDKFNEDKKYGMIISTQGDILPAPVVTGDASLDITDEIIAGLNEEYVKNKNKAE